MIINLIHIVRDLKALSNEERLLNVNPSILNLAAMIQTNYLLDSLIKEVEGIKVALNTKLDSISDVVEDNGKTIESLSKTISDTITALNT